MKITNNFTLEEIEYSETAVRNGFINKVPPDGFTIMETLFKCVMQPLREATGGIIVTSGYRSPRINELVGGSYKSQHIYKYSDGAACDFVSSLKRINNIKLVNMIIQLDLPFDQLILEYPSSYNGGWVHVSIAGINNTNRKQILVKDKGMPYYLVTEKNKYGVKTNGW